MDQQVVRFILKKGITWQDGEPLKASDSEYSFEIAKSLYPQVKADLLDRTRSYLSTDEQTIEWRGIPGYRKSDYALAFFSPFPEHAWGSLSAQDLLTAEVSTRTPIGWGPFAIKEWVPGDHISFTRNPEYFRKGEGLPHFDQLVFRFIANPEEAFNALRVHECDVLDGSYNFEPILQALGESEASGDIILIEQMGNSWEQINFGIKTLSTDLQPLFQSREVRQAFAYCVDRQKIIDQVFQGKSQIPDTYVPPGHPLANQNVRRYGYDPDAGIKLLEAAGWIDHDNNPATPRSAQGVDGIGDGLLFEVEFLLADIQNNQTIGSILQDMLAQCGIGLTIKALPAEQLYASGDGSLIFGRNYSLAQYGWMGSWQPACLLFTSQEIPGPYPQYVKGWGGSNSAGYSSLDFDRACQRALTTMPDDPQFQSAHFLAQSIFAEDLPALPLFQYTERLAFRTNLCGVDLDPSAVSMLWDLENFFFGEDCSK